MDSIRVSEAPDPGSIPGEATLGVNQNELKNIFCHGFYALLIFGLSKGGQ